MVKEMNLSADPATSWPGAVAEEESAEGGVLAEEALESVYAPPAAAPPAPARVPGDGLPAASRTVRLAAWIIDRVLILLPAYLAGGWWAALSVDNAALLRLLSPRGILGTLLLAAVLAVNAVLLARQGQTLGKRVLGIQIVGLDDRLLGFTALFGWRILAPWLIRRVPVVGGFFFVLDPLAITTPDKRCLHDYMAGSKVVLYQDPATLL